MANHRLTAFGEGQTFLVIFDSSQFDWAEWILRDWHADPMFPTFDDIRLADALRCLNEIREHYENGDNGPDLGIDDDPFYGGDP